MNKRIRELAEQSGLYFDKDSRGQFVSFPEDGQSILALEYFVESIISEIEGYIEQSEGDVDYIQFLIDRNLKGK